jgi:hypothetical protein
MSRVKKLEELFGSYSDLSTEAIVKEELLTHGISWDRELKVADPCGLLRLEDGPYSLRRTIIRVNKQHESPYQIESNGKHLKVVEREGGEIIALAHPFPQDSAYQSALFADGTPYAAVVSADAEVNPVSLDNQVRDPAMVADAVAEIFVKKQRSPREMPSCILIGGRNVSDSSDEPEVVEFFLRYVDAIRDRIGHQVPILLEMSPMPVELEEGIHRHGVEARLSHPGVWDEQLFALLCARENQKIAWDEWVRRVLDQVYVYGWNAVLPRFAVGLEMSEPSVFKSSDEALISTSEGIRFLMMHGVVPNLIHWRSAGTSGLAGRRQPPTEFFLEVDMVWYDAWVKYGQDEPIGYLMGPGRSRYPDSGVYDIGRGAPLSSMAKNPREKVQDARSAR